MKKKSTYWPLILVLGLVVFSFFYLNNKINKIEFIKEEKVIMTNNFAEIIEDTNPSIVHILAETNRAELPFTGGEYILINNKVLSSGTGFVISDEGYILTANHVVKEAKDKIIVRIIENKKLIEKEAKLISSNNDADIALLKINGKNLKYVKLGDPNKFKEGADIGFIGFPLGLGFPVVHKGIISGKINSKYEKNLAPVNIFIINAFVNQGNSGGPLFSADSGEVVGIINARMNVVNENQFIKLPPGYSPGMTIGGVDPISLSVETYNSNLRLIGNVVQVGIGYSTSIEYGKQLFEAVR